MPLDPGQPSARVSEAAGAAAGSRVANAGRKRTKTGCSSCRVRRRKCDEGKPRCKRCANRNLDCQYPSGFTFLEKNILVVGPSTPAAAAAQRYSRLQFIEPSTPTTESTNSELRDIDEAVAQLQSTDLVSNHDTANTPFATATDRESSDVAMVGGSPDQHFGSIGFDLSAEPPDMTEGEPPGTTRSDGFETALQVLVSLSTGSFAAPAVNSDAPGDPVVYNDVQSSMGTQQVTCDVSFASDTILGPLCQQVALAPNVDKASLEVIVSQLRNYRYHVAPWLDICDMGQFFGTTVPIIATHSVAARGALLGLSAVSLSPQADPVLDGSFRALADFTYEHGACDDYVAALLLAVASLIRSAPSSWRSVMEKFNSSSSSTNQVRPEHAQYLSCLHLRLDLAVALLTGVYVSLDETPMARPVLDWNIADWGSYAFQDINRMLKLCARAANLCSGYPSRPLLGSHGPDDAGLPLAQEWRLIAEELNAWYCSRPEKLQPVVELDHSPTDAEPLFPAILFTNGAAILGNQMYHTAMMLLLQHKPRTLVLDRRRLPAWSPLWHAQRVCGIALSNDRRECWDLLLLASFYLAAKSMTYEPQQRHLLRGLDVVSRLTKWNVDHLKTMLQQEWHMPDSGD